MAYGAQWNADNSNEIALFVNGTIVSGKNASFESYNNYNKMSFFVSVTTTLPDGFITFEVRNLGST